MLRTVQPTLKWRVETSANPARNHGQVGPPLAERFSTGRRATAVASLGESSRWQSEVAREMGGDAAAHELHRPTAGLGRAARRPMDPWTATGRKAAAGLAAASVARSPTRTGRAESAQRKGPTSRPALRKSGARWISARARRHRSDDVLRPRLLRVLASRRSAPRSLQAPSRDRPRLTRQSTNRS